MQEKITAMPNYDKLDLEGFARLFGASVTAMPASADALIGSLDFRYRVLKGEERDVQILRALKALDADLAVSGRHRQPRWESGWQENLEEFIASGYDPDALVPKFVKRNEIARVGGHYVSPISDTFETNCVKVLRDYLFNTYFNDVDAVFEFGCGTGHNLVQLARMFPQLQLIGLDWAQATTNILTLLNERSGFNIRGGRFDFFAPDTSLTLPPHSGVFTIGALEQTGVEHESFIRFLISRQPRIVLHIETLYELYDQSSLEDYVAARYLEKRGYLRGLVPLLQQLASEGKIELMKVQRTFGSLYHDGYSFIAWRPLPIAI